MSTKVVALTGDSKTFLLFSLSSERKQYRKEAMNQCIKPIKNKSRKLRAISFAIAKLEERKLNVDQKYKVKINNLILHQKCFCRLYILDTHEVFYRVYTLHKVG